MLVGGRKSVPGELAAIHPGEVRAFDRCGLAGPDLAEVEPQSDGLLWVGVRDLLVERADGRHEAQLLLKFTAEGGFPRFTLLELASRELPEAGEMGTGRALGDQEPPISEDEAGCDIQDGGGTHVQGVGLTAGTTLTELVRLAALFSSGLARRRVARRMKASLASCR